MNAAQRALRSRLGGLTTAARHDPREYTASARAAWKASDHTDCRICGRQEPLPADLTAAERERRRQARLQAHYARMAYRSVRSRGKKKPASVIETTGSGLETRRGIDEPTAA
jgi:hypothetical protein